MLTIRTLTLGAALVLAAGAAASARPGFTPGSLVVVQDGTGSGALSANATAASLMEFTTGGAPTGFSVALPTAASGSNHALTLSGTATSEGFLTLSGNGRYLTLFGYDAAPGTASITSALASATARVVGRVDDTGNVDTSTALTDGVNLGNARSSVSDDGTRFWVSTSATGVRYQPFGVTGASTQLNTAVPTNVRVMNIFNNQLYMSSASGAFQGVGTIGAGLQTTSGQTPTLLNGFPTAAGPSPYDFFFADANTLYVADDRGTVSGGGIQKWTQSGGLWSLAYTLNASLTAGVRGLCGVVLPGGGVVLYATTAQTSANQLVTVTDSGGGSLFTVLATAPTNTAFRGVDFAPIPSPGALALLGAAGLLGARRRR